MAEPLLSICIPIYNRLPFLERQLERMAENKELFKEKIQLIISDNCSEDDLQSCCEKYQMQGLNLKYHRKKVNLGADGNFDWCFHHAEGKYVWLLGSDDIPVRGLLQQILEILESGEYGLVHLSTSPRKERINVYHNDQTILADINIWITFMSSNIIKTETVKAIDLSEYVESNLIQVPAYLNSCLLAKDNALVYLGKPFEIGSDSANNGGYNFFGVFVENLFDIYGSFIDKGLLSRQAFERIKKIEYRKFLLGFIVDLLLLKTERRRCFDLTNSWKILWKHYGLHLYAYYYVAKNILGRNLRMIFTVR